MRKKYKALEQGIHKWSQMWKAKVWAAKYKIFLGLFSSADVSAELKGSYFCIVLVVIFIVVVSVACKLVNIGLIEPVGGSIYCQIMV